MLLYSLPNSWDNSILAITANIEDPKMDALTLVANLLSREMGKKIVDSLGDDLNVRGRPKERGSKGDKNGPKDKSKGRYKTLGKKNRVKCWNCGKRGNVKKECKIPKKKIDSSTKKSSNSGDEAFVYSLHIMTNENWLIDSRCSYHMNPHKEWFPKYEKYDGGKVYLSDNSSYLIVERGKI